MKRILISLCSLMLALANAHLTAAPLGTAFTYQGRLTDGANPANGTIPMVFGLWDANLTGNNVGSPSSLSANVPVAHGLFTIDLDFGAAAFSGEERWLEIRVNGTLMTSRQRVAPTPSALYALTAGSVRNGAIQASQLSTAGVAPVAGQVLGYNGTSLVWKNAGDSGLWSPSGSSAYYNGGHVGIGTIGPSGKLTVATADDTAPAWVTSFDSRHSIVGTASEGVGISYSASTGAGYITALAPGVAWKDLVLQAKSLRFNLSGETMALSVSPNGNVGIGESDPNSSGSRLQILGQDGLSITGFEPFMTLRDSHSGINSTIQSAHGDLVLTPGGGFVYLNATSDFLLGGRPGRRPVPGRAVVDGGDALHLNFNSDWANTVIGGNNVSVCTLTIRGGCDLAEPFQMSSQEIPKGAVVVIDQENAGKLKLSHRAYDHRVAGIVSGANGVNPGIALHQEGLIEGGQNVALTGRVYVQADASNGRIEPGDLLTTSDIPGHAMKVRDHVRAQGAIIGKAMSALPAGKGMVLVLVSLQ